ncbi:MAG TPA: chemotaxis-specific protein-glutamate methyltransferase CheB [Natrialbaceae archaeon]|nr:chemotaxis-specific protein-glutamate methyltransferase CheB [Natrialbaceae archaeon]
MTSVLVVDDSQFMRTVIGNLLSDHGYEVYSASDGERAVEAVETHAPDIVTMDVVMPGMDGIEAVERIMKRRPTPILMLSAHTKKGADATFEALSKGAVDFLAKPGGEVSVDIASLEDRLVETVEAVADADLTSIARDRTAETATSVAGTTGTGSGADAEPTEPEVPATPADPSTSDRPTPAERSFVDRPTLVIGASTGGPKIVERVLAGLPLGLDARVLVVQHMPGSFTDRLAARLDSVLDYDVSEASDGDRVEGGEILVAKGGHHLEIAHYVNGRVRVRLTEKQRVHGVRPAIDVTMRTAADRIDDPLVGVVCTGMGKDGAAGIEAIEAAGGHTIAQDRATSPVFGIPRQAIATGAVDDVLPADEIADGILDVLSTDGDTNG